MIFLILQLIINSLSHSLPAAAAKPNLKHERCIICGFFFFAVTRVAKGLPGFSRLAKESPRHRPARQFQTTRSQPERPTNSDRKCFGSKSSTSGVKAGHNCAGRAPGLAGSSRRCRAENEQPCSALLQQPNRKPSSNALGGQSAAPSGDVSRAEQREPPGTSVIAVKAW